MLNSSWKEKNSKFGNWKFTFQCNTFPRPHLFVQRQQWKHQNNVLKSIIKIPGRHYWWVGLIYLYKRSLLPSFCYIYFVRFQSGSESNFMFTSLKTKYPKTSHKMFAAIIDVWFVVWKYQQFSLTRRLLSL